MCILLYFFFFGVCLSPLTKVKLINELNEREANLGINEKASWHSEYKDSAWVFIGKKTKMIMMMMMMKSGSPSSFSPAGGFPYELSEGDVICVFSQYVTCCLMVTFLDPAPGPTWTVLSRQVRRDRQHQSGARQEDGQVQRLLLPVLRGPEEHHLGGGQFQWDQGDIATALTLGKGPYLHQKNAILGILGANHFPSIIISKVIFENSTNKISLACSIQPLQHTLTWMADNLENNFVVPCQIKGRTIRVDHVRDYRPPKDHEDIDDVTRRLREEGCAPSINNAPPASPSSLSQNDDVVPVKKSKKGELTSF